LVAQFDVTAWSGSAIWIFEWPHATHTHRKPWTDRSS